MNTMETVVAAEQTDSKENPWNDFSAAVTLQDYFQSWLALQCGLIAGTVQGLLIMKDQGSFTPVAAWPRQGSDPELLADIVERSLEEGCGLVSELAVKDHYAIAYPVQRDGQILGTVALVVLTANGAGLQQAMEQLQWGVSWLELAFLKRESEADRTVLRRLKVAVDLLAVVLGQETFDMAAMAFATELAAASNCERVSIGFLKGRFVRLQAVSNSVMVGEKMNLTRSIERVMDEALTQHREIAYPLHRDEGLIYREHEALSRQQSMASLMSCPLYGNNRYYGVILCERAADQPFTEQDIEFIRSVAALNGPALDAKFVNDRPLMVKVGQAAKQQIEHLFGAGFFGRKLALFLFIAIIVFFCRAEGDYRLTANTVLEGAVQRAIVVPFNGYIDQAPARAGDLVEAGQLLCSLDERELRLEKSGKDSKFRQLENQYQEALAKHDRAQSAIIKAQLEQLQAELDLLAGQLGRTRLTAPFAGLLVSGDLSQRLGSAVEQGEVLFEVTPLDAYRIILKVDERRIADVAIGQKGTMVLSSLPQQRHEFRVDKITPITIAEDGRNYFRVETYLTDVNESMRPGMEGVGKISIDRRKLISIWTRDLVDWVRLTLWNWLP